IVDHYRRLGVHPSFELMPAPGFADLARALTAAGAVQEDVLTVLAGAGRAVAPPAGVEVIEVGPGDRDTFAGVLARGHAVPEGDLAGAIANCRRIPDVPGTRCYLALAGGEPAAAAVLHLPADAGISYLANASTLPAHRR